MRTNDFISGNTFQACTNIYQKMKEKQEKQTKRLAAD